MTSGLITLVLLFLAIFWIIRLGWAYLTYMADKDQPPWPPREDL